jgi:hypothetical protein
MTKDLHYQVLKPTNKALWSACGSATNPATGRRRRRRRAWRDPRCCDCCTARKAEERSRRVSAIGIAGARLRSAADVALLTQQPFIAFIPLLRDTQLARVAQFPYLTQFALFVQP